MRKDTHIILAFALILALCAGLTLAFNKSMKFSNNYLIGKVQVHAFAAER